MANAFYAKSNAAVVSALLVLSLPAVSAAQIIDTCKNSIKCLNLKPSPFNPKLRASASSAVSKISASPADRAAFIKAIDSGDDRGASAMMMAKGFAGAGGYTYKFASPVSAAPATSNCKLVVKEVWMNPKTKKMYMTVELDCG